MTQESLNNYDPPNSWDELVALSPRIGHSVPEANRNLDDLVIYHHYNETVPKGIRLQKIVSLIGDNDYKILKNDFPYSRLIQNLPKVTHYCLWSRIGELTPETIKQEIVKNFPSQRYMYLENSPETKSMPEIWHCHIFIEEK